MEKNKEIKIQYIGPFKVLGLVKLDDYQTPSGGDVVRVLLVNKSPILMTLKSFNAFVTEKPVELTDYREKVVDEMSTEIIKVIMEYNLTNIDISYLLKKVGNRILDSYERACNMLWTGNDNLWIPGVPYSDTRSIIEADLILQGKSKHVKNEIPTEKSEEEKK